LSLYKTNIGASFAFVERDALGAPAAGATGTRRGGGYFHLAPGEIFVGGGMWHPDPAPLAGWRTLVMRDPGRVHAAIDAPSFRGRFGELGGDRLRRPPSGVPVDHPELPLLLLKDVTFGRRLGDDEAFSPNLPEALAADLATAAPLLRLLAALGT
jgi:uncharacterized protein (DUF2461 family)